MRNASSDSIQLIVDAMSQQEADEQQDIEHTAEEFAQRLRDRKGN